uniref:Uncharacterized protein n=1 Tax=Trichuris muris TaxID=70415 RepID=A0A5S6PZG8_TRIMR
MPVRRPLRRNADSACECPMRNRFDDSYLRYRHNLTQITRRYARFASEDAGPNSVIIDMTSMSADSRSPDFPSLEDFGSDKSKLSFPDFSWTSASGKESTSKGSFPCSEPTDICISRCNSTKLAFSMVEKTFSYPVQRMAAFDETMQEVVLPEKETKMELLEVRCSPEEQFGTKVKDHAGAEDAKIGERLQSKATAGGRSASASVPMKACAKNVRKIKCVKTKQKPEVTGFPETDHVSQLVAEQKTAVKGAESPTPADSASKKSERQSNDEVIEKKSSRTKKASKKTKPKVNDEDAAARLPMVDTQMCNAVVKSKSARRKSVLKLRFEKFPQIVTHVVEVPVPQDSMLCEPRQKAASSQPSKEEDEARLSYLFDHMRLTDERIRLWFDLHGDKYRNS